MPLLARLRYALFLAIALTMIAMLVIALGTADVVDLLPSSAFEFAMGPGLFLLCYAVAFFIAPDLARRFPIKRDWQ